MEEITREGGCQCGDLRYRITGEPLAIAACHCADCQTQSGSAFSMSMVVRRDAFEWTLGRPQTYSMKADSGADKHAFFCGRCGARIYNALSSMPETFNVKPGTLDDTSWLEPAMHVWTASAQGWVPFPEGTPRFERNPKQIP